MKDFFSNIWTSLADFADSFGKQADEILVTLIKIAAVCVFAWLAAGLLRRFIRRVIRRRKGKSPSSAMAKKAGTIETVAGSVAKYLVWFLAVAAILGILGLTSAVGSLLATAGIGGIAIAFGAQGLVKDITTGFFILMEDQFAVGEYVDIEGEKGTVEAITIRTTRIKRFTGEVTTIPNGSIAKVTNYSRGDHLAVIDIAIPCDADIEKASAIMRDTGLDYKNNHDNILEEPHVLGVEQFGDSNITLRMIIRVKPLTHWETERALRRSVREALDSAGLKQPYPRRVVINE
jgi:Small-conductance mechanosensitive channel